MNVFAENFLKSKFFKHFVLEEIFLNRDKKRSWYNLLKLPLLTNFQMQIASQKSICMEIKRSLRLYPSQPASLICRRVQSIYSVLLKFPCVCLFRVQTSCFVGLV